MKSKSNRKTTMARKLDTEEGGVYWAFLPFFKAAVDVVNGMWNARECRYEKSIWHGSGG